jgi:hypothetical protein
VDSSEDAAEPTVGNRENAAGGGFSGRTRYTTGGSSATSVLLYTGLASSGRSRDLFHPGRLKEKRGHRILSGGAVPGAGPSTGRSSFAETSYSSSWWEEPTRVSSSTPDERAIPANRFYVSSSLLAIPSKERRGEQLPDRWPGADLKAHFLSFSCGKYRRARPECVRNDYLLRRCLTRAGAHTDRTRALLVLRRYLPTAQTRDRRSASVCLPEAPGARMRVGRRGIRSNRRD